MIGSVLGAVIGLLGIYIFLILHPLQLLGALVSGAVVSAFVIALYVWLEPLLIRMRGYREPSRREMARLEPILLDAARHMELQVVPAVWISDAAKPGAWSHMRAIVVTHGLLGEYDASENAPQPELDNIALTAILAHELQHWNSGDVVGSAMVTSCFFPLVVLIDAISWVRARAEWAGVFLWFFFWPIWIASKLVVVPLMASRSREYEYQADACAAGLGEPYRLGLRRALADLSAWERPRTGWEDVLAATHPPIEHRLQMLEAGVVPTQQAEVEEPAPPKPARRRATTAASEDGAASTQPTKPNKPPAAAKAKPPPRRPTSSKPQS